MSLTNEEKIRINEEEVYRSEVRASIEKGKPKRSRLERIWEYLNSPLALWILSTIVVSAVTVAYTRYTDRVKKAEEQRQTSQRIEDEVINRQKEMVKFLDYVQDHKNEDSADPRWIYKTSLGLLDGTNAEAPSFSPVLHPEFKDKSLFVLLEAWQQTEVSATRKTTTLVKEYNTLKKLADDTPAITIDGKPTDGDAQNAVNAINKVRTVLSDTD